MTCSRIALRMKLPLTKGFGGGGGDGEDEEEEGDEKYELLREALFYRIQMRVA